MKFTGIVQKGKGEGKKIGFPTANILLTDKAVSGIYAGRAEVGGKEYVAAVYADQAKGLLEAHLLDFAGDLYGQTLEIELFDKIREAAAFENVEQLAAQIAKDVETIRALMHTRVRTRSIFYLLIVLVAAGAACLLDYRSAHQPVISPVSSVVAVQMSSAKTAAMRFEIVTDPIEQERGLGGRTNIPANYGMLFVFPKDGNYGFWMKDMLAPIDIIWLSDSGTILGIEDSVAPSTYPSVFYPPHPVRYVLETRAGEARTHDWYNRISVPIPLQN